MSRSIESLDVTVLVDAYTKHQHVSRQPRVRMYIEGGRPGESGTMTPAAARLLAEALNAAADDAEKEE